MQYGLRILTAADADVDELALFIAQGSVEHALRFYDAIRETYKDIRDHPERWPIYGLAGPGLSDIRKYVVMGFSNYLVFYRIDADMVEIVRVIHGSRDIPAIFAEPS